MNAEIIMQEMEALLSINIKMSDRLGLETLSLITVPRARMLLNEIKAYRKEKSKAKSKHIRKEPAWLNSPE